MSRVRIPSLAPIFSRSYFVISEAALICYRRDNFSATLAGRYVGLSPRIRCSGAHRQKRGGQFTFISMDEHPPEERYQLEPADHETPETNFLRQWALTVLKQAMNALQKECEANGKALLLREAKNLISGELHGTAYAQISKNLDMGEGAVRVAVHRLRQRYGELLRREVAHTVTGEEEV